MSQFFKFIFASCLGTILAMFCLIAIFTLIAGVAGAGLIGSQNNGIANESILLLEFNTPIPELSNNVARSGGISFESTPATGLHELVRLIRHAQNDPKIEGIVYKAGPTNVLGTVTASTIREELKAFRDSTDKFVYAYGDFYDNTSYLIASSADSIFANPNGMIDVNGYAAMLPFFKGTLEKLDVDMDIYYAGQFKSATEPFRRKDMSEQNRFQTREYLEDNFQLYLDEVSASRNIPKANLQAIINELNFDNSVSALDKNLIDGRKQWYQLEDMLRNKLGVKGGRALDYVDYSEYAKATSLKRGSSKNRIAVVYAEGSVVYANDDRGNINEVTYHEIFDKIRKDDKVKAVVLRVNSGGGSAFTSDVILREMQVLQSAGIPVIASFGDYAASGGYYIAASADKIVSHPKTLTGSIGVFAMMPNLSEMMEKKLGITFDTVKTSPYAVVASPFYKKSPEEDQALQKFTDNMYDTFLTIVSDGRGIPKEAVHEVAQGRVWTGQRAIEKGLVDVLGGLETAIELAAESAEIEDYKIVEYPKITKEFWEQILEDMSTGTAQATIASKLNPVKLSAEEKKMYAKFEEFREVMSYREPMARIPFIIQN